MPGDRLGVDRLQRYPHADDVRNSSVVSRAAILAQVDTDESAVLAIVALWVSSSTSSTLSFLHKTLSGYHYYIRKG